MAKKNKNKLIEKLEKTMKSNVVFRDNLNGKVNKPPSPPISPLPEYVRDPAVPFGSFGTKEFNNFETKQTKSAVLSWLQGDNLDRFKSSKLTQPPDWTYRTKKVSYTINRDGYRCPSWEDINWEESIVLFGCSCTFGIGVTDEDTIAAQLEKLSGRPVINLGVPGGSNSLIIQNGINLLEFFKAPYAVANIWSTSNRLTFFDSTKAHYSGPWDDATKNKYTPLWQQTFINPSHEAALYYYEAKMGKWLWQGKSKYSSISFFPTDVTEFDKEKHFVSDCAGRDLQHPGQNSCRQVAEYLSEKFK